ncbi:hypothetical protein PENTCL1PPCAC_5433, partial [Pristionchus entomophagus]
NHVNIVCPPFFISSTVIAYFIANNHVPDVNNVVVVDLTSGSCYLQEIAPTPSFPPKITQLKHIRCAWHQTSYKE